MIADLAAGEIDVALLWGPIAGYWASRQAEPMAPGAAAQRAARAAAGLSHLDGHPAERARLEGPAQRPDPRAAARDHGDPRELRRAPARQPRPAHRDPRRPHRRDAPAVPEPEGYRTERYRAPTPATLEGATVVDTPAPATADRERAAGPDRRLRPGRSRPPEHAGGMAAAAATSMSRARSGCPMSASARCRRSSWPISTTASPS